MMSSFRKSVLIIAKAEDRKHVEAGRYCAMTQYVSVAKAYGFILWES